MVIIKSTSLQSIHPTTIIAPKKRANHTTKTSCIRSPFSRIGNESMTSMSILHKAPVSHALARHSTKNTTYRIHQRQLDRIPTHHVVFIHQLQDIRLDVPREIVEEVLEGRLPHLDRWLGDRGKLAVEGDVIVAHAGVGDGPLPVNEAGVVGLDGVGDDDRDDRVGGEFVEADLAGVDVQHGGGGEVNQGTG